MAGRAHIKNEKCACDPVGGYIFIMLLFPELAIVYLGEKPRDNYTPKQIPTHQK
jgi:hypothetical protein